MSRILIIGDQLLTMGAEPLSREIGAKLTAQELPVEYAAGHADALLRMQMRSFGVVITSCDSELVEDLALLTELRAIRPGLKCIVLARQSTPDDVITALRARVFACCTPPFDINEIAYLAASAASDSQWRDDIQVLSAKPGWVSVRVNCRLINAERLMTFAKELSAQLPEDAREDMLQALREILLNAMEHGAAFNPDKWLRSPRYARQGRVCFTYKTLARASGASRFSTRPWTTKRLIQSRTRSNARKKECAPAALACSWPQARWMS